MRHFKLSFGLYIAMLCSTALADHPNEGQIVITQLINEAEQKSLEIKQAEENLNTLKSKSNSQYGRYSPKLSIEGGPQTTNFDGEKQSDTSIYGKAEWNIYSGGSDKAAADQNKSEVEIEERRLQIIKNKVKNDVSKIYYEIQFLLESITLKKKALELNSQQIKIAKAKNNSGFTTNSDVLEFDLRDSTLQSDLILLNQQLEQKSRDLNIVLSKKNSQDVIQVKGHLERVSTDFNRNYLIQRIKTHNEQILLSNNDLKKIQAEKKIAESNYLPKLDLEAKYGKLANEEKVFNDKTNYAIALKVKIPLFSGFEDYNLNKSLNAKNQAIQHEINQKNISLESEVDILLSEIKALNSRLDLEEKNIEKSEKYYKLTLDEYKRGVKNSPDMVGASERLLDARIRNLEYRRDLLLTKMKIQNLIGE